MTGKNKNKVLLILVAVLVMICAIYFIITKVTEAKETKKESEATAESEANRIWVTQIDEVTGISIHDGDTQLDFEKTDGTWYTTEDIDFPVDQDKMSALVSEYSDVESSRSLVNGDDLSAYGLDAPSLIISVTDGNGVVTQLLVGDKVGDEYYLKTADNTHHLLYHQLTTVSPHHYHLSQRLSTMEHLIHKRSNHRHSQDFCWIPHHCILTQELTSYPDLQENLCPL